MTKKKPSPQNRIWEKERRERLNKTFDDLQRLLPEHEPASTLSKVEILQRAIEHINKLQKKIKTLVEECHDPLKDHVKEQEVRLKRLLVRNEELAELLRKAKITVPPCKYTIAADDSQQQSEEKENGNGHKKTVQRQRRAGAAAKKQRTVIENQPPASVASTEAVGLSIVKSIPPPTSGTESSGISCSSASSNTMPAPCPPTLRNINGIPPSNGVNVTPALLPTPIMTTSVIISNNGNLVQVPIVAPPSSLLIVGNEDIRSKINLKNRAQDGNPSRYRGKRGKFTIKSIDLIPGRIVNGKIPIPPLRRSTNDSLKSSKAAPRLKRKRMLEKGGKRLRKSSTSTGSTKQDKAHSDSSKAKRARLQGQGKCQNGETATKEDGAAQQKQHENVLETSAQQPNQCVVVPAAMKILPKEQDHTKVHPNETEPTQDTHLDISLNQADLSEDIFANLHVGPDGSNVHGGNDDGTLSPTAAYLMNFPLVAGGGKAAGNHADTGEADECHDATGPMDHQQSGSANKANNVALANEQTGSLLLDNFSSFFNYGHIDTTLGTTAPTVGGLPDITTLHSIPTLTGGNAGTHAATTIGTGSSRENTFTNYPTIYQSIDNMLDCRPVAPNRSVIGASANRTLPTETDFNGSGTFTFTLTSNTCTAPTTVQASIGSGHFYGPSCGTLNPVKPVDDFSSPMKPSIEFTFSLTSTTASQPKTVQSQYTNSTILATTMTTPSYDTYGYFHKTVAKPSNYCASFNVLDPLLSTEKPATSFTFSLTSSTKTEPSYTQSTIVTGPTNTTQTYGTPPKLSTKPQQQQQEQQQQQQQQQRSPSPRKMSGSVPASSRATSPTKGSSVAAGRGQEQPACDHQEVDGAKARGAPKPPLVRSETYEERCRKILGMPNRPAEEDGRTEAKSIFSTYDNTVTVQQSRSELREQRKKIEQEIKSMESKTMGALADERDSVVAGVSAGSRRMSIAKEPSPTRKMSAQHGSPTRKPSGTAKDPSSSELTKERSPSRKAPSRDISPIAKETPAPAKQPSKEVSPARKSPAKDGSPARSTATPKDGSPVRGAPQPEQPAGRKEVSPARKEHSTETTRSKATILVEQKQEGRNISVAEITILPVLEVSHEAVRTKTTASRTHEKVLTKQSSDTKFDRRATSVANSRVITNKSSSDFDIKRRVADLAAPDKRRAQPATTASPDKRRAAQPAQQKPNHITVAKIKIESPRKPTAGKPHPAEEPKPTGRQPHRAQAAEPETDPESSKDTGLSDNSEVEETVESVIEMSVTGTACCRHTDRKDSAPVYRTTGAARSGKSYTRSSSDNHLRATSASTHRHQPAVARDGSNVSAASATLKSAAGGRKVERPVKHVATKTINLATKPTAGSDSLDNVVIDIQLAKSSREPTPNKLVPIPVSPDTEDAGKPRYPDAVQEPDDEAAGGRPARNQRVSTIPIFEEATSEYVGCEITEVDEQQEASAAQQATRITNLDRVTEDDESLLSVTEKVNKFAQEARRLQADTNGESQRPPSMGRFAARPEYDDLDDHLKSDECLLSVSDKVTKFISTAEEVKKIRTSGPFVPGTDDGPVKVADGDECLLSVNEKVSRFASRMTRAVDARDDAEEDESDQQQRTAVPGGLGESVPGKFVPQRSPELVKNAMRTTARHLVEEHAPGDELAQSVGSIASRYRTATMAKPYEKAPAGGAPAASPITLRSTEAVKKAKELFEKGHTDGGRQRDILNRPSVWEERRTRAQPVAEPKRADVKLTDIGVTERKAQTVREEHVVGEESAPRKPSITKVEQQRPAEPAEAAKPTGSAGGRRDSSGSGVRPPAYIRDVVSTKKDLFEKRISSSKMQVEYTSQTSQEATETQATATLRKQSLKQAGEAVPSPSTPTNRPSADQSKPSYMNHTVASLEHINANQRRDSLDHGPAAHHETTTTSTMMTTATTTTASARSTTTTGSAKFGVELKRLDTNGRMVATNAPAVSSAGSKRKPSTGEAQPTAGSSPAIEEIFDLELLERMLESVTGYEQRRRIRAQIRVVKKQKEQQQQQTSAGSQTQTKQTSVTTSKSVTTTRDTAAGKRKDSSPTRASVVLGGRKQSEPADATDAAAPKRQASIEAEGGRKATANLTAKTMTTVTTERFASKAGTADRVPPTTKADDRPIWATSNILKKASENTRTFKSVTTSASSAGCATGGRKVVSTSSSYHQQQQQTKTATQDPKTTTDCITSSYGVGPTDENGLPLFGIRALKKKAAPAPADDTATTTKISGTVITETLVAENGGPAVGKRSTTHYKSEPSAFGDADGVGKLTAVRKTETIDAAGTHAEEFEMLDGLELAGRREAKVVRKGSVKELTERFIHRESSGSLTQDATRTYPKAGLILRSSAQQSQSSRASTPATDGCSVRSGSVDGYDQEEEEAHSMTTMTTRQVRSFLNDTSKVVDVRDVLQRMSNADNVTEQGDSAEDQEARALLNKFLGASVLMSGVESMVSSPGTMLGEASAPSASGGTKKVSKVSSTSTTTKTVKSSGVTPSAAGSKQATVDTLEDNWDEAVLKQLLESTTNYDDRRKIRARIRQVMAEKEACADIVAIVTADLQRERHLQQQQPSGTMGAASAGSGGAADRQTAATAAAANGLSQVQQTTTRTIANTKMESQDGSAAVTTRTTVTTKTVASSAPKPMSPFAKFRQLDKQNSLSSQSPPKTLK